MNEMFYCRSLNLVAYLMSKGIEPEGFNDRSKSLTFYFKKNSILQERINDYNQDIELKEFITAFKRVKEIYKSK